MYAKYYELICMFKKITSLMLARAYSVNSRYFRCPV